MLFRSPELLIIVSCKVRNSGCLCVIIGYCGDLVKKIRDKQNVPRGSRCLAGSEVFFMLGCGNGE